MLARGGTIHLVLPWPAEEFVKTSVEIAGDGAWVERFEKVLARAASIRILGELYMPGSATGFEYCNLAMNGLARLFARSLDLEITPLAMSDGICSRARGHRILNLILAQPPRSRESSAYSYQLLSMLTSTESFDADRGGHDDELPAYQCPHRGGRK